MYIELEEKTLMESLEKLIQVEFSVGNIPLEICPYSALNSMYDRKRHGILRREVKTMSCQAVCR